MREEIESKARSGTLRQGPKVARLLSITSGLSQALNMDANSHQTKLYGGTSSSLNEVIEALNFVGEVVLHHGCEYGYC